MKHRELRPWRLESHGTSLNALVDRLSTPVLLMRTGMLRYSNSAGQEVLRQAEYLVLRDGYIQLRSERQNRKLANMLSATPSDDSTLVTSQQSSALRLIDVEGRPAVLIVQALRWQASINGLPLADAVFFLIHADKIELVSCPRSLCP